MAPLDGSGQPSWPLVGVSQRQPPQNQMAEQALLGAILRNNKALDRCDGLLPEHFADAVNGRLFKHIVQRRQAGALVDGVTLASDLANAGVLDEVGGNSYIAGLLAAMVGIINATEYAATIRDCWVRRQLIDLGTELVNGAFGVDPGRTAVEIARGAATLIDQLGAAQAIDRAATLDAAMDEALAAMERARTGQTAGMSTGFGSIDARLGGIEPGLVYVLGGRPGMGKSALAHQIAINVARAGVGVLELSLEMSAAQLGRRALASTSRVPIWRMKRGDLDVFQAEAVVCARKELAGLPLTIDDAAGQTPAAIAAKARAARRKHGLGLVMIDHLNLMRAEDQDARHGGTWATERASATVLQMAKDCECPALLLAQLNRGVEGREDKRPTLSDLRQAGAIEQDAYAVGFVYRPEYYLGGKPDPKPTDTPAKRDQIQQEWEGQRDEVRGRADLVWAKVRDGEPGTDALTFDGPTATFGEPRRGD